MTRKTNIGRAFERYEVDIDGTVVTASIDLRDSNINKAMAKLMRHQGRLDELRSASAGMSGGEMDAAAGEVAAILHEAVSGLIGEEAYSKIVEAVLGSPDADPADANFAMAHVFSDLFAYVVERLDRMVNGKSAKYLAEAARGGHAAKPVVL